MALKDKLANVPVLGTALRVQERYKADAGDQFAAAIGFFGFLSLFPLIILALSVTGFVLAGRPPGDAAVVADAITDAIPGFSAVLGGDCPAGDADCSTGVATALDAIINNRGSIGLIGLVSLLFTGLRVTNAAQTATLKIFRIDLLAIPGWKLRLRQLVALVALGLLALLGVAASSSVGYVAALDPTGALAVLAPIGGVVVTLLADLVLFVAAYRLFLATDRPPWRRLLPGALLAAVGWAALKIFGSTYISGQVADASELYGALGGVIGLLLLFYLAGRLYVYGAELSALRLDESAIRVDGDETERVAGPDDAGATIAEALATTADVTGPGDGAPQSGDGAAARSDDSPDLETGMDRRRHEVGAAIDRRVRSSPTAAAIAEEARVGGAGSAMQVARVGRPTAYGAGDPSPAVSARTRDTLRTTEPVPGGGPRHATAFVLAVTAVGGLVAVFKPWERDD